MDEGDGHSRTYRRDADDLCECRFCRRKWTRHHPLYSEYDTDIRRLHGASGLYVERHSNLSAVQLQQLQNYFADSIIVGDSIAQNFDYYNVANGKGDVVSDNFKSASAAAYTVSAALMPVDGVTAHPMIRGQRMRIPDAVKAFGSKHVYSFFGWKSVPDPNAADEYEQLLREIQRENPGVDVTVISATYMCKGFQTAENNNDMVRAYNEKMKQKCRENGWGYLDVAPFMNDGQGNLPDEMSVDKQIHYKYPYYSLWVELMKKYALARSGY